VISVVWDQATMRDKNGRGGYVLRETSSTLHEGMVQLSNKKRDIHLAKLDVFWVLRFQVCQEKSVEIT
jgi:hypothetical protein